MGRYYLQLKTVDARFLRTITLSLESWWHFITPLITIFTGKGDWGTVVSLLPFHLDDSSSFNVPFLTSFAFIFRPFFSVNSKSTFDKNCYWHDTWKRSNSHYYNDPSLSASLSVAETSASRHWYVVIFPLRTIDCWQLELKTEVGVEETGESPLTKNEASGAIQYKK